MDQQTSFPHCWEGPMHHSCMASLLSGESTPLLGMGKVKPPPGRKTAFSVICSEYHSLFLRQKVGCQIGTVLHYTLRQANFLILKTNSSEGCVNSSLLKGRSRPNLKWSSAEPYVMQTSWIASCTIVCCEHDKKDMKQNSGFGWAGNYKESYCSNLPHRASTASFKFWPTGILTMSKSCFIQSSLHFCPEEQGTVLWFAWFHPQLV